jgi:hypothetical protein
MQTGRQAVLNVRLRPASDLSLMNEMLPMFRLAASVVTDIAAALIQAAAGPAMRAR